MPSFPHSSKLPWKPLARLSHAHHWFSPRVLCLLVTQVLTVAVPRLLFVRELFSTHSCVTVLQLFLSHKFQTFSLFWTSSFSTNVGYDLSEEHGACFLEKQFLPLNFLIRGLGEILFSPIKEEEDDFILKQGAMWKPWDMGPYLLLLILKVGCLLGYKDELHSKKLDLKVDFNPLVFTVSILNR